ncbi:MAG: WG repeat-containing protein [Pseudomonadota bacterium]
MVRRFVTALCLILAGCGSGTGMSAEQQFEESLRICRIDDLSVRLEGLGAVYYTIIGRMENDCEVEMVFINAPNAGWVDQPLLVRLREDRSGDALRNTVAACIEGRRPFIGDGSCAGALMDVLRLSRSNGGPVIAQGPFENSGCGTEYQGDAPARLRMRGGPEGLWGYLDRSGNWAIAPRFAQATAFSEGLAAALEGDVWQIIDPDGAVVIANVSNAREQSYTSIYGQNVYRGPIGPFSESCARFSNDTGKFFLSRDGQLWLNEATPSMIAAADAAGGTVVDIEPFGAGFAGFHVDREAFGKLDPQGYIDSAGSVAIAPQYAEVGPFDAATGLAPVGVAKGPDSPFSDGWIYINSFGRQVLPKSGKRYRNAEGFCEGRAAVRIGRQYQYIDATGTLLSEETYNLAHPFSDGMAYVRFKDDGYGWIDRAGKEAIRARGIGLCDADWPRKNPFEHGLALVIIAASGDTCGEGAATTLGGGKSTYKNGEFAYIDKAGAVVFRESALSAP